MSRREDNDPVYCCLRCCSLGVETMDGQDYCRDCGSTDIAEVPDIYAWERMYIRKYGHPYVVTPQGILRGH